MSDFLKEHGYKMWKEETCDILQGFAKYFQKKINVNENDVPVCKTNDALYINVEEHNYNLPNVGNKINFTINIKAENQNEDWCDIGIYGISYDKFKTNIETYENQIIDMWIAFYGEYK